MTQTNPSSASTQASELFLDSSVVRSILLGTQAYQRYFASCFQNSTLFISPYIEMELTRSYLRNVIEFYFILALDSTPTISDALALWSNCYKGSQHKAIEQMIAQLLQTSPSAFANPTDKAPVLSAIATTLIEFTEALRMRLMDTEQDRTQCARAQIPLAVDPAQVLGSIEQFAQAFDDVETCRNLCRVDQFLLEDYQTEITAFVQRSDQLPKNAQTRGFIKIADNLRDILDQGSPACSCKRCERIGDAIIALDAPRQMQLECTDNAFDYLCPLLSQPHRKHPSEVQIVTREG